MPGRPAETTAITAALALLVARLLGVDDADTIAAIGIVIGFIPAIVTYVVNVTRRA